MKLYHGSDNGNIEELTPRLSNHGKPYVYLIENKALAVMYAYNPVRPQGFFTYGFDKHGIPCYNEYFENQLEIIYKGKSGYLYEVDSEELQLEPLKDIRNAYITEKKVIVEQPVLIEDIYEELLALEKEGLIKIRRYDKSDEERNGVYFNQIVNQIIANNLINNMDSDYAKFLYLHFPRCFETALKLKETKQTKG